MLLTAYIDGISLLGPALADWPSAQAILIGLQAYQPNKTVLPPLILLPPAERRRTGTIVKLSLVVGIAACEAAQQDPKLLPCIYTSSSGDGDNCHAICETLASKDRAISPTRFHNSVHNAAPGYWGIATGAMTNVSVLCAFDGSFGAGLLEAIAQVVSDQTSALLIAADSPYPQPLQSARPLSDALGIGLVLTPHHSKNSVAQITVHLTDAASSVLSNVALEALRMSIPAARGLPLLQAIARQTNETVVLDYLDNCRIAVAVKPC
jgi:Beta-ketoacyl synthase, N-terminal domain